MSQRTSPPPSSHGDSEQDLPVPEGMAGSPVFARRQKQRGTPTSPNTKAGSFSQGHPPHAPPPPSLEGGVAVKPPVHLSSHIVSVLDEGETAAAVPAPGTALARVIRHHVPGTSPTKSISPPPPFQESGPVIDACATGHHHSPELGTSKPQPGHTPSHVLSLLDPDTDGSAPTEVVQQRMVRYPSGSPRNFACRTPTPQTSTNSEHTPKVLDDATGLIARGKLAQQVPSRVLNILDPDTDGSAPTEAVQARVVRYGQVSPSTSMTSDPPRDGQPPHNPEVSPQGATRSPAH